MLYDEQHSESTAERYIIGKEHRETTNNRLEGPAES